MKVIKTGQGWISLAGVKYGWERDNYNVQGVALKMFDLQSYSALEVHINGVRYLVNSGKALAFIKKYNAVYEDGKFGVVSRSILREIGM